MNAANLDAELTFHLNMSNDGLYIGTEQGLLQARLHIAAASGILSALAPDELYLIHRYQEGILTAHDGDELANIQRIIFQTAFGYLNQLAR